MEDPHIVVQIICVFTSASNPNSSYGVKIWGYIDFGQGWRAMVRHSFQKIGKHISSKNLNPKFKNWYWNSGTEQTQLAWPFTPNKMVMLQYDEVFFRLTTPAALPTFAGAESLQKPHHIS